MESKKIVLQKNDFIIQRGRTKIRKNPLNFQKLQISQNMDKVVKQVWKFIGHIRV